jgi:hypothetical protein
LGCFKDKPAMFDDGQWNESRETHEVVAMPLSCAKCSGPVTLKYRRSRYQTPAWVCPYYECRCVQRVDLPGVVVNVVPRNLG